MGQHDDDSRDFSDRGSRYELSSTYYPKSDPYSERQRPVERCGMPTRPRAFDRRRSPGGERGSDEEWRRQPRRESRDYYDHDIDRRGSGGRRRSRTRSPRCPPSLDSYQDYPRKQRQHSFTLTGSPLTPTATATGTGTFRRATNTDTFRNKSWVSDAAVNANSPPVRKRSEDDSASVQSRSTGTLTINSPDKPNASAAVNVTEGVINASPITSDERAPTAVVDIDPHSSKPPKLSVITALASETGKPLSNGPQTPVLSNAGGKNPTPLKEVQASAPMAEMGDLPDAQRPAVSFALPVKTAHGRSPAPEPVMALIPPPPQTSPPPDLPASRVEELGQFPHNQANNHQTPYSMHGGVSSKAAALNDLVTMIVKQTLQVMNLEADKKKIGRRKQESSTWGKSEDSEKISKDMQTVEKKLNLLYQTQIKDVQGLVSSLIPEPAAPPQANNVDLIKLTDEIADLKRDNQTLRNKLNNVREDASNLKKELREDISQLHSDSRKDYNEITYTIIDFKSAYSEDSQQLKCDMGQAKAQQSRLDNIRIMLDHTKTDLDNRVQSLEKSRNHYVEELEKQVQSLETEMKSAKPNLQQLSELKFADISKMLVEYPRGLATLSQRVLNMELDIKSSQQKLQNVPSDITVATLENTRELEKRVQTLETEAEKLQLFQRQSENSDTLKKVKERLAANFTAKCDDIKTSLRAEGNVEYVNLKTQVDAAGKNAEEKIRALYTALDTKQDLTNPSLTSMVNSVSQNLKEHLESFTSLVTRIEELEKVNANTAKHQDVAENVRELVAEAENKLSQRLVEEKKEMSGKTSILTSTVSELEKVVKWLQSDIKQIKMTTAQHSKGLEEQRAGTLNVAPQEQYSGLSSPTVQAPPAIHSSVPQVVPSMQSNSPRTATFPINGSPNPLQQQRSASTGWNYPQSSNVNATILPPQQYHQLLQRFNGLESFVRKHEDQFQTLTYRTVYNNMVNHLSQVYPQPDVINSNLKFVREEQLKIMARVTEVEKNSKAALEKVETQERKPQPEPIVDGPGLQTRVNDIEARLLELRNKCDLNIQSLGDGMRSAKAKVDQDFKDVQTRITVQETANNYFLPRIRSTEDSIIAFRHKLDESVESAEKKSLKFDTQLQDIESFHGEILPQLDEMSMDIDNLKKWRESRSKTDARARLSHTAECESSMATSLSNSLMNDASRRQPVSTPTSLASAAHEDTHLSDDSITLAIPPRSRDGTIGRKAAKRKRIIPSNDDDDDTGRMKSRGSDRR